MNKRIEMVHMIKRLLVYATYIAAISISLHYYSNTAFLINQGLALVIHGIAVSKTLLLIFALSLIIKLSHFLDSQK